MKLFLYGFRFLTSVWSYFVFVTIISFGFLFLAAPAYLIAFLFTKKPKVVFQWLTRLGFNITFLLSPAIWKINIKGKAIIQNTKPAIYTPSHRSFLDYLLMESIIYDIVFLTNKKTSQFILFRYVGSLLGAYFIDRKNLFAYYELFAHFKKNLQNGTNVLIFPEGTRNNTSQLSYFHNGSFKLSIETGVPIVPVLILNSDQVVPKGHLIVRNVVPVTINIVFLEPIFARKNEKSLDFANRVRSYMQDQQEKLLQVRKK